MIGCTNTLVLTAVLLTGLSRGSPHPRSVSSSSLANLKVSNFDFAATREAFTVRHSRNLAAYNANRRNSDRQAAQQKLKDTATALASNSSAGPAQLFDLVEDGEDVTYLLSVSFGTPAQTNRLVIDTGSGDLWTTDIKIINSDEIGFDPTKSSTINITQTEFMDTYGTGSVMGTVVSDVCSVAGFTLNNRVFGVGTIPDSANEGTPIDGIFPMSNSILSTMGVPTYFEDLMSTGAVSQPYFSIYLGRGASSSSSSSSNTASLVQNSGQLCMGCIVNVATVGSVVYTPVTEFAFWTIALGGMSIDGKAISSTSGLAIIDSGTTIALVPTAMGQAIASALGGQVTSEGAIVVPVDSVSDSTQFGFTFGNTTYTILPTDLVQGFADNSKSSYELSIMVEDITDASGQTSALLGDIFLKNVLAVFSYSTDGEPAVGFAQLSSDTGAATTASMATGMATATAAATGGALDAGMSNMSMSSSAGRVVQTWSTLLGGSMLAMVVSATWIL